MEVHMYEATLTFIPYLMYNLSEQSAKINCTHSCPSVNFQNHPEHCRGAEEAGDPGRRGQCRHGHHRAIQAPGKKEGLKTNTRVTKIEIIALNALNFICLSHVQCYHILSAFRKEQSMAK